MDKKHHFTAYLHSPEETLTQYATTKEGISETERAKRLSVYGNNVLDHKQRIPWWIKFLQQFKDLMIVLLIVSAWIARWLQDTRTTIILGALVLINAWIGYAQEAKAERLLEKLRNMVQAKAKIIDGGVTKELPSNQLVPWDILVLNEGDAIPADVRLIEERNLQTNDFSLTGESNPKRKHIHTIDSEVELWDRTNMCFMGTTIATGNGLGVVIGTWMNTELWRIASLSSEGDTDLSPLQKEMNHTAKMLTYTTLVIWTLLFCVALFLDRKLQAALLFAIGIAASMVPQWLPAQISIALASSAWFLAKKNALVKKLSAVETLWAVNVICTDKTGTLTTNEMTVQQVRFNNQPYTITGIWYEPTGEILDQKKQKATTDEWLELFLSVGVLASNAHIQAPDKDHSHRYVIGDPTEWALLTLAAKAWITEEVATKRFPLVQEFCFDSSRKRMSMVRKNEQWHYRVWVKGSLQTLLPCCSHTLHEGKVITLDEKAKQTYTQWDDQQASHAMRNLAYAYKDITNRESTYTMDAAESDLTFLGMVSMIDPPRQTVPAAIEAAKQAHIKIIVITWDYSLTAQAIGQKIGLWEAGKEIVVFSGQDLRSMSDIAVSKQLIDQPTLIFSRVSPEDKVRIVGLCKKLWRIVAVTGDGVNDAPALKQADIWVAMGKTGTDVAKEAAEIILLDDSFATLVEAIRQGRIIYQNITKNVLSCITTNWAELFAVILGLVWSMLWGVQMAITAVQILAIDLIWEMGPLAALSQDPGEEKLMREPARDTKKHILRKQPMRWLVISWLVMGACAYGSFLLVTWWGTTSDALLLAKWQATTYLVILLSQFVNIMSRRVENNNFFTPYLWANKKLLRAMGISLVCINILFHVPFVSHWFRFASPWWQWLGCALLSALLYWLRRYRAQWTGKKWFV